MIKGDFMQMWNTVKYIQTSSGSCPTRKCHEKDIKITLLPLLNFGGQRLQQPASAKAI